MRIGIPISIHTDMNKFLLTLSLLFAFPIGQCKATEWYTGRNPLREATFEKGILQDGNYREGLSVVNLTETGIQPGEGFRPNLSLDLANLHNRAGKKYPVYRIDEKGKPQKCGSIENPVWGVVWGYRDSLNFHALRLRSNPTGNDEYGDPTIRYQIITVAGGDTVFHAPWSELSSRHLNPETDYNHLCIEPVEGGYEIFMGHERECRLGICRDDRLFGSLAGVYVGSGAQIGMKNWTITPVPYPEREIFWTPDDIKEHLSKKAHPAEGYYEFLQASSANSNVRLGGDYRLALLNCEGGMALVYIAGAQRLPDQWKTGMVKAILQPTGLQNLFNVIWFDTRHKRLSDGIKATFSENGILTIYFTQLGVILEWNRCAGDPEAEQSQELYRQT